MLFTLLLSFPLAYFQTWIKNITVRKLYSLIAGVWILQFCFSYKWALCSVLSPCSWIHCFLSSTIVYLIVRYGNPKRQPVLVFIVSLAYLSSMYSNCSVLIVGRSTR